MSQHATLHTSDAFMHRLTAVHRKYSGENCQATQHTYQHCVAVLCRRCAAVVVVVLSCYLCAVRHALAWCETAVCLQTSRHERDEAEKKLNQMTAENADRVQRFHDMKSTEVERMNEVNRACEEMVCSLTNLALTLFPSFTGLPCINHSTNDPRGTPEWKP